ncbi:MAG: nuclear transport factor 2 family protein [Alphaproteobacteria bacterium]|nr:nuclear transport factor 2 family protein [Alphaproteobacteria bacterium]
MTATSRIDQLSHAIQRYLDLMYDGDVQHYERVFRATAQLHGLRDGKMAVLSSAAFKDLIAGRQSPKALGAPRFEEILLVDVASPTQAMAKVRVRIGAIVFVDYLTYHWEAGDWTITAKGFHVERTYPTPTTPNA